MDMSSLNESSTGRLKRGELAGDETPSNSKDKQLFGATWNDATNNWNSLIPNNLKTRPQQLGAEFSSNHQQLTSTRAQDDQILNIGSCKPSLTSDPVIVSCLAKISAGGSLNLGSDSSNSSKNSLTDEFLEESIKDLAVCVCRLKERCSRALKLVDVILSTELDLDKYQTDFHSGDCLTTESINDVKASVNSNFTLLPNTSTVDMGVGQNNSSTLPEAAAVTIDSSDEDKFDEFLKTVVLEEKNMNNGN